MGLFNKKKKKVVIGYQYYLGMHLITGHGNNDSIEKIKVGEKVAWTESNVLKDSNENIITSLPVGPQAWKYQSFTPTENYLLSSIALKLFIYSGYTPGTITISIRATGDDGHPTGGDLSFGTTNGNTLVTNPFTLDQAEWREIEFNNPIILSSGVKYAIVVRTTENASLDTVQWVAGDIGGEISGGNAGDSTDEGESWSTEVNNRDMLFRTYKKSGSAPESTISINNTNLFGGPKSEGGVSGAVDLLFGSEDQGRNSYLQSKLDSNIPAFRGLLSAILKQVYIGTSSYLKPWSFLCKRVSKQTDGTDQWYYEKAVIRPRQEDGDDLNPAHIIRECLIAPEWGAGWEETDIDDDYFKEAANILYEEEFGLSMMWDQVTPIEDFINEILKYIAGMLYQDLSTGKWRLVLTRDKDLNNPYDYNNTNDNNQASVNITQNRRYAQTFTTNRNYKPASGKIKIYKDLIGSTINARCEIQEVDSNGKPNGTILCSGGILTSNIGTSAAWVQCTFNKSNILTVNTQYALVIYPTQGTGILYWRSNTLSSFGPYSKGRYNVSNDDGATWSQVLTNDFMFEIYAGEDLETFDEDEIIEIEEFGRPAYGEIIDQVVINFWDKLNHKSRSTEARDIALIEKQNNVVIEKVLDYQGICNNVLANKVAERELKLNSSMLAGMRIKATRKMSHLKPNDVFILSWSDLDINQMAIRVLNVDYGSLHNNEIMLECSEDSFAAVETIYGDAADTEFIEPVNDPADVTNRRLIEIPYYSLYNDILGLESLLSGLDNDDGYIGVVAEEPSEDSFDYDIYARLSASYDFIDVGQGNVPFTPTATITDGLSQNGSDETIDLSTTSNLDLVEVGTYAIINEEIIGILAVDTDNNQVTISRGILDTVPQAHSAGDRIYFMEKYFGETEVEYTNGDQPQVKLLSRTANGSLAEGDSTIETADALNSRMIRPYPPGNLKFNGFSFPSYISSGAAGNKISLTWNHRDRTNVTQLNSLVKHTTAINYGPEAGTTYTIEIYDGEDNLGRTVTGLSGTSYDYTEAFEVFDFGSLQETLKFVVYAVNGGYNSWNDGYTVTIKRSMRGSVSSSSNLSGELIPYFDGRSDLNAASSGQGALSVIKNINGSSTGSSNLPNINLDAVQNLTGSSSSSSGATGDVTIPEALTESYTSGIDSQQVVYHVGGTDQWLAQTFTASENYDIIKSILKLYKTAGSPGNIEVAIRATDGSGLPTGVDLCSGTLNADDFTTDSNGQEESFNFGSPASLTNGTKYAIVLKSPTVEGTYVRWKMDSSGAGYAGGNYCMSIDGGSSWSQNTGADFWFENYK